MSDDNREDPRVCQFLRELVIDLERSLAAHGFGVMAQRSSREPQREATTLMISTVGSDCVYVYRFEYRPHTDDSQWIRDLALQLRGENLTAIYAVADHEFSSDAEREAQLACVGLHEVSTGRRNRLLLVRMASEGQGDQTLPPMILTQKLK